MENKFSLKDDNSGGSIFLLTDNSGNGDLVEQLSTDDSIYFDPDSEENKNAPSGWNHVTYKNTDTAIGKKGWIESKFIGEPVDPTVAPVDEGAFVRACARAEYDARELRDRNGSDIRAGVSKELDAPEPGDMNGAEALRPVILADYLIALAWIESSGLTKFGHNLAGTSAIGPFQLTKEEWAEFVEYDKGLEFGPTWGPFYLYQALAQIAGAVYLTQRDWIKLVALAGTAVASGDPFVPSFLNLFHARLVGPEAAFALNEAHGKDETKNQDLEEVLKAFYPDDDARKKLRDRRKRFLRSSATDGSVSVNAFFENTSAVLGEAFIKAFTKLKDHFPEFANPPAPSTAPWLDIATTEEAFWAKPENTEASPSGSARILQYFQSTDYHPTNVEPWCGAFAAHCIAMSGDPDVAASVIKGAAMAANWKTWGDRDIRIGNIKTVGKDVLRGAVVVLHPGTGTGSSGHVAFALNRMENSDKIECISGNQSDTVKRSSYAISRIASIRVLEAPDAAAGAGMAAADITQQTVDLVKRFEGLKLDAYQDSVGVWTIGYGTTSRAGIGVTVQPGMTITQAQAEDYLTKGLVKFANKIRPFFTRDPVPNQFGAMLSLAYNIGPGAFKTSTCLRRFNAGDLNGAAEALTWFNKAGGKVLNGLVARRAAERDMLLS